MDHIWPMAHKPLLLSTFVSRAGHTCEAKELGLGFSVCGTSESSVTWHRSHGDPQEWMVCKGTPQSRNGWWLGVDLPSGKLLHNYGKSPCLMGKSTISMAIFHSYVSLPRGSTGECGSVRKHVDEIWWSGTSCNCGNTSCGDVLGHGGWPSRMRFDCVELARDIGETPKKCNLYAENYDLNLNCIIHWFVGVEINLEMCVEAHCSIVRIDCQRVKLGRWNLNEFECIQWRWSGVYDIYTSTLWHSIPI